MSVSTNHTLWLPLSLLPSHGIVQYLKVKIPKIPKIPSTYSNTPLTQKS